MLELQQCSDRPIWLGLRGGDAEGLPCSSACSQAADYICSFFCANGTAVCDDGVPLPLERRQLERGGVALAAAAGALAHPLIADGVLLVQTTGCRWKTLPK